MVHFSSSRRTYPRKTAAPKPRFSCLGTYCVPNMKPMRRATKPNVMTITIIVGKNPTRRCLLGLEDHWGVGDWTTTFSSVFVLEGVPWGPFTGRQFELRISFSEGSMSGAMEFR